MIWHSGSTRKQMQPSYQTTEPCLLRRFPVQVGRARILKQGAKVWNQWREKSLDIVDLNDAHLSDLALNGVDLYAAKLRSAHLYNVILYAADLRDADLSYANLAAVDLRGVSLRDANLYGADISLAILDGADLRGADLRRTTISQVRLNSVNLNGCRLGLTALSDVDLSTVKGLDSVKHDSSSVIGIDTIYRSGGNIPDVFLRGAGVPENFISYMHSLVGQPNQYFTCFISFTEADDLFSKRLYNDLQGAGVRCWRWKEDAKWGKTLMREIDEAVRFYDKLVVICSEHSLNAPPVIREIERALQKEDELARQGKEPEVLFPIRLDDYIFDHWQHYRKADVTAKNVGDFRNWHDPQQYRKALDRLVRNLKH